MRRVLLESPYKGKDWSETEANIRYARECMHDCIVRGEAPFASHLLYTQEGILNDRVPGERKRGIDAGLLWGECAEASVVYVDHGISEGMKTGIKRAKEAQRPVEYRSIRDGLALIESIVTDQGNGGSYCSGCRQPLDIKKVHELDNCPGCKRILIMGEMHTTQGGSDF
ncbi:MAG: hypothetical protein Q7S52_00990 [bacterium]|nr:hypothetical protein [bacterium]